MKITNEALTVATVEKCVTPPPTKSEVLRATARALAMDHQKEIAKGQEKRRLVMSRINQISLKRARKLLSKAVVECTEPYKSNAPFEVQLTVAIPANDLELVDLWNVYRSIAVPKRKSEDDFLNELKIASATVRDRVPQLLADPKVLQHLLDSGKAILGAMATQGAKPAIEA